MRYRIIQIIFCSILSIVAMTFADEGIVEDTSYCIDSTIDESTVVESVVHDTEVRVLPLVLPTTNRAQLLLVDDKINFESLELDIIDEADNDEDDDYYTKKQSILLDNKSSGFGFIIPGGILTTMGGFLLWILIPERSSFKSPDDYKSLITACSVLTSCGITSFTFGMFKQRIYIRMNDRYTLLKRIRTAPSLTQDVAPVAIR
jgi:hypothetical protein